MWPEAAGGEAVAAAAEEGVGGAAVGAEAAVVAAGAEGAMVVDLRLVPAGVAQLGLLK